MANAQRGEVTVTGRDGRVYVAKLGISAICELEKTLDRPVLKLFEELQQGTIRVTTIREFVKAATSETTDAAADAMLENTGITPMLEAMTNSLLATFGIDQVEAKADPPAPAAKTSRAGAGSSKVPANPVSST